MLITLRRFNLTTVVPEKISLTGKFDLRVVNKMLVGLFYIIKVLPPF